MLQAPNCRGRAFEALILKVELQDLVFALLGFGLALVQYFSTLPPFFPFGESIDYFVLLCVGSIQFALWCSRITVNKLPHVSIDF